MSDISVQDKQKHNEFKKKNTQQREEETQNCGGIYFISAVLSEERFSIVGGQALNSAGNGQQLKIAAQRCNRERCRGGGGVAVV